MSSAHYDLHLHTEFSPDCDTAVAQIEAHCLTKGLTGVAVTDHDSIEGALRLRDMVRDLDVIVGQEVTSRDGDVIGLFLVERIPPKMSAADTMESIRAQGGLVYLPHPFDRLRARRGARVSLDALISLIDIVEVFNGKSSRVKYNTMAAEFARKHGLAAAGGSDAHTLSAIGTVRTELDDAPRPLDVAGLKIALKGARISGRRRSPLEGAFVLGRRPFSLAWRHLLAGKK